LSLFSQNICTDPIGIAREEDTPIAHQEPQKIIFQKKVMIEKDLVVNVSPSDIHNIIYYFIYLIYIDVLLYYVRVV
jgi:hypothetical protein